MPDYDAIILGADGFLGRNFVRYFADQGWVTYPVGRSAGDLTDAGVVDDIFRRAPKLRRVFHLVTRQRTGLIQYDIQADLLAINARIHLNVLEAWKNHQPQAKLISVGSSCAYPESDRPLPEGAFQSGPMHDSVRGYGLAKQLLAVAGDLYAKQYGLEHLHCILATVYGPHDHKEADRSHFLTAMLDRAVGAMRRGEQRFVVWGDPDTVRECLYVDDQIEAILAADSSFSNRLINCGANQPVTIGEVADGILKALDWKAEVVYPPDTFRGASYKVLDSSQFLAATGWSPRYNLLRGIRATIATESAVA